MKNVLLLLSVVFNCLFSTVSLAQTAKSISKDDALAIAQKQFVGKDVDYYILSNSTSVYWNIFVDAEPMVSVSAMLVYTCQKNIAQAFILERYFFVSICPAAIPGTCLSVFLAAVLPLC